MEDCATYVHPRVNRNYTNFLSGTTEASSLQAGTGEKDNCAHFGLYGRAPRALSTRSG